MDEFNTDLFIDEIEKRTSIWDMTSRDYSNKIIKRNAWEEMVLIFCEEEKIQKKKRKFLVGIILFELLKS